jgi:hypothetical protein
MHALAWRNTLADTEDFTEADVKKIVASIWDKESQKAGLAYINKALNLELRKFLS